MHAVLLATIRIRRRANARNVSFRISLRWLIHIINPVDKTQLSKYIIVCENSDYTMLVNTSFDIPQICSMLATTKY